MIITLAKSATGRHHFRADGKLLWIGSSNEKDAIAAQLKADPPTIEQLYLSIGE